MENLVSIAIRSAIKRAKRRKNAEVTRDDILIGLLQTVARFDIVQIGEITIDLDGLEESHPEVSEDDDARADKQKVAYSPKASAVFDRAARIAKRDNSSKIGIVHLLVAFANEDNTVFARLKEKYGVSGVKWRSALSRWQPESPAKIATSSKVGSETKSPKELNEKMFFTPDEAAVFLDVHPQTIRGYIRTGKLAALRLAGERALRIQRNDLLALLEPYKPEEK
jgi:excisionase family DNA binding protein